MYGSGEAREVAGQRWTQKAGERLLQESRMLTTRRPGWILNIFGSRADKLGCGVELRPPAFLVPGNNLAEDSFSL